MTESKPPRPPDFEDLSTRARRSALAAGERQAFERALESSATMSIVHRMGRDFDEELRVRSGDEALILRVSQRALMAPRSYRAKRRSALAVRLAVAALVVSAAAAATLWLGRSHSNPGAVRLPTGVGHLDGSPAALGSTPWSAEQRNTPPATERERNQHEQDPSATKNGAQHWPTATEREREREREQREQESASMKDGAHHQGEQLTALATSESLSRGIIQHEGTAPELSASELFREASTARRRGDIVRASSLYAELQTRFPSSSEAHVSHVSLGKLLLTGGHATEAERQFGTYLSSGERALEEEALVGRADCLARLGKRDEEKLVWQELLRRYASSVYATRATERLKTLRASGHSPSNSTDDSPVGSDRH